MSAQQILLVGVIALLCIGLYSLLIMSNLIKIVIGLQILSKSLILALVVAGELNGKINLGQSLALTVIVADTVATIVGLALAVQVRRHFGTLDVRTLSSLKG